MDSKTEMQPFLAFSDEPREQGDAAAGDSGLPPHHGTSKTRRTRGILRDMCVCVATSLLWVLVIWVLMPGPAPKTSAPGADDATPVAMPSGVDVARSHNITSGAKFISCGNSTAEAHDKGCKYDMLLNAWVPSQCLDQEWIDEYQDDGSWTAFANEDLTEPLSPDAMGERDHYYTSIRDHINHCAMLWRKQFWTLFEGRRVFDAVIASSYHTEHCATFLSELFGSNRTRPTLVRVGFSGCWVRGASEEL